MKKKLFLALLTTLLLLVAASAALADSPSNYICTYCDVPCTRWVPVNSEGRSYHIPCCDLCENLWLEDLDRLLCTPIEGSATCTTPAVCSVCGFVDYYGSEPDPNAHDISDFYYTGPETHYRYCLNGCYARFDEGPHTGGTATCADYPTCTVCNMPYGDPDPTNHDWGSWSSLGNGTHIRTCTSNSRHTETANCSGGTATCTEQAICTDCGQPYGDVLGHAYGEWISNDNGTHTRTCANDTSHTETAACTGGVATCTEQAICDGCGQPYGEVDLDAHDWGAWQPSGDIDHPHTRSCQTDGCNERETKDHDFGWINVGGGHISQCQSDNCSVRDEAKDGYHVPAEQVCYVTTCTVCGLPCGAPVAHTWSDWYSVDEIGHRRKCTVEECGVETTRYAHEFTIAATCTTPAKCEKCGYLKGEVLGHDWGSWEWLSDSSHIRVCLACYSAEEEAPHSGGDGSCMPTCEDCKYQYYDETSTKHNTMSSWVYWNYAQHYCWCMACGEKYVVYDSHYGGDGSCKPVCEGCGVQYLDVNGQHNNMSDWAPFDDTQHFRVCNDCVSTESMEYSEHSGGTATCTAKAVCTGCGQSYGTTDFNNHINMSDWAHYSATQHYRWCLDCDRSSSYEYEDHYGGDGSCLPVICEGCGERYEDPNGQHRNICDWVISDNSQHRRWCLDCNDYESMEFEDHYGGTATCTAEAICEGCGSAYGTRSDVHPWGEWMPFSITGHIRDCTNPDCSSFEYAVHTGGDGSCSPKCADCGDFYIDAEGQHRNMSPWLFLNDEQHISECIDCGGTKNEYGAHTGGTANCAKKAVCDICGEGYGELASDAHIWGDWKPNGDGTHTRVCKNDATHTETANCIGGTSTCTEKAKCEVCATPYGDTLGHVPGAEADCANDQVCTRTGCDTVLNEKLGHKPGAEATCTNDQLCTREGCGAVLTEKLGHDYTAVVTEPTCTKQGYTTYTCTRCGDSYKADQTAARGHWYDPWYPNQDGTHSADCKRYGCDHVDTTGCTLFEITVKDGETDVLLTVCPVCGDHEDTPFEVILEAMIEAIDRYALLRGELIARGMDAPFDGVIYAFTAAYEYAGKVEAFKGLVSVTLPLDVEKFAEFKLVRVDVTPATETTQRTEVWTEVAFAYANGELTFETDAAGLFLLLPAE